MPDEPDEPKIPLVVETLPSVAGGISAIASANAPFVYFEDALFYGLLNGIGCITITASRLVAQGPDGKVVRDNVFVAHLRGNLAAIQSLRAVCDGILLMAEPKPEGKPN